MSEELKPCPFCGGLNISDKTNGWGHAFHQCNDCKAQGPARSVTIKNPWANPVLWNTRAEAAEAKVAELVEALRGLEATCTAFGIQGLTVQRARAALARIGG